MLKPSHKLAVGVVILAVTVGSVRAGEDASSAFRQGQKALAGGDLRGALKQYGAAVKLDANNQQYVQQYLMVRQVVMLQGAVAKEADPKRWEQMAVALRSFFSAQGLHAQALTWDQAMWEKSKTVDNAIQLADTLLALDKTDEVVSLLANLDGQLVTDATQALLAVALARQGKLEDAKQIAARTSGAAKGDPGALYLVARMHAMTGNSAQALAALTQCYEAVPPSRLESLKSLTRQCNDFAPVASLAGFATVMETVSKVPESKCSGGASCSSCPMRGNCAHDAGK